MEKIIKVKGVEVKVIGDMLVFEKDGVEVKVNREIGRSDYSVVYLELVRKGSKRNDDGWKKVGNFEYMVFDENKVNIRRIDEEENLFENVELEENELKYIRTAIINILINNL